jgi:hypothetical protein
MLHATGIDIGTSESAVLWGAPTGSQLDSIGVDALQLRCRSHVKLYQATMQAALLMVAVRADGVRNLHCPSSRRGAGWKILQGLVPTISP